MKKSKIVSMLMIGSLAIGNCNLCFAAQPENESWATCFKNKAYSVKNYIKNHSTAVTVAASAIGITLAAVVAHKYGLDVKALEGLKTAGSFAGDKLSKLKDYIVSFDKTVNEVDVSKKLGPVCNNDALEDLTTCRKGSEGLENSSFFSRLWNKLASYSPWCE